MGRKKHLEHLKEFKRRVSGDFPLNKLILFGSRAKGKKGHDTDFDLLIVSAKFNKMDFFERGAKMYKYWELDYPADFLCYTTKEFNKMRNRPTIIKAAIEEGVEI